MRIAIVTETYPPEINGVALTVQSFVEQLAALGHTVLLTRPRQSDDAPQSLPDGVFDLQVAGGGLPRYPGLRFGWPAHAALRAFWAKHRPEAVYIATEGPLGWSALQVARSLGLTIATGFHTRFDAFIGHYGARWLSPVASAWMRRFHNQGHMTLVPTRALQSSLLAEGFHRPVRLARAVDTTLFNPLKRSAALRSSWGVGPDDLAVIHFGRIAPEKNLPLLSRAFHAIQAVRPSARLIVIGDGPALPALKQRHPEYRYVGMRRDADLAAHVASGDLFLFPSLTETFGNVTLEAMASGVATVAFDYGAAAEHLRDDESGAVVPVGDDNAFVLAAVRLATRDANRRAMAACARDVVRDLSPRAVAAALVQRLAEVGAARREAA